VDTTPLRQLPPRKDSGYAVPSTVLDSVEQITRFLTGLYQSAGDGYSVELRGLAPDGDQRRPQISRVSVENPSLNVDVRDGVNWFFSVASRHPSPTLPVVGCFAWADIDHPAPSFDPAVIKPVPSFATSSGHGYHLYWRLTRPVVIEDAVRISAIASLALDGDKKVNEAQRLLRLPGTPNLKPGMPPTECRIALETSASYTAEEIEEWLIAAIIARTWTDARHYMAMGAAATLFRADWTEDSAERIIGYVCDITKDEERNDRLRAVHDTYSKARAGETISAQDFRDALTSSLPAKAKENPFSEFLVMLGVTGKDGDIMCNGEAIATKWTIEQDLTNHLLDSGEWAMAGGIPHLWNGNHWQEKTKEQFVSSIFQFLETLTSVTGDFETPMPAHLRLANTLSTILQGLLPILPESDPKYLAVQNGMLELATGLTVPHDKKHGTRVLLPVSFDPEASCSHWERFLHEAVPTTKGYLQEWFGYLLMVGNPEQLMLWLHGPSGTGKSTFVHGIETVFGNAAVSIDPDNLSDYNVASLETARVAVCTEIGNRTLKTAKLKSLVSGDPIGARSPYGKPFTFTFRGKLLWASNSTPPLDQSEGMFRRLAMVPFENVPKKEDRNLWTKLDEEAAGILNWGIAGLKRVQRYIAQGNWAMPAEVTALIEEYKKDSETYATFVREELVAKDDALVSQLLVYSRYKYWCQTNGFNPQPNGPIFRKALRLIGLEDGPDVVVTTSKGEKLPGWKGYDIQERVGMM
jgi:putative DNA primase/helicase